MENAVQATISIEYRESTVEMQTRLFVFDEVQPNVIHPGTYSVRHSPEKFL